MGCEYSLAPNGRRTRVHEERKEADNSYSTTDISYNYDKLNRLVSESSVSSTQVDRSFNHSYVYDLNGNRLKKDTGTETIEYVYNSNDQLETETSNVNGGTAYVYNDNGSLIEKAGPKGLYRYTYNLQNRLATAHVERVENASSVEIDSSYVYNQGGIRVRSNSSQTVEGNTSNKNRVFLLDGGLTGYAQVMEESASVGGALTKSYVLGDDVLSQSVGGTVSQLLYDGHGSTRMLAGVGGTVSSRYDFDAYGKMLGGDPNTTNPAGTDLLYSGEQFDAELGLQYLRARYYDQNAGVFNRFDDYMGTKYDPQSLHKYAYCHADPINRIDPSGNTSLAELKSVTGIIMKLTNMVFRIINVIDKIDTFVDSINMAVTIFRIFSGGGDALLRRGLNMLLNAADLDVGFMRVLSKDFLYQAAENLQTNMGKIVKGIASNISHPRISNALKCLTERYARILIFMPTPNAKFVPNPLLVIPTGIKLKFKKYRIRVSLYFGHGGNRGRYFGIGMVPNMNRSSLRRPHQLFRMDWHSPHLTRANKEQMYWEDRPFHYHLGVSRKK